MLKNNKEKLSLSQLHAHIDCGPKRSREVENKKRREWQDHRQKRVKHENKKYKKKIRRRTKRVASSSSSSSGHLDNWTAVRTAVFAYGLFPFLFPYFFFYAFFWQVLVLDLQSLWFDQLQEAPTDHKSGHWSGAVRVGEGIELRTPLGCRKGFDSI